MASRWRAAAGDGELGGGATLRGGVREVGKNGEGMEEARMPYLAWARAQRGGVLRDGRRSGAAAMASGGDRRQWAVAAGDARLRGGAEPPFIGRERRWRRRGRWPA